MYASNKTTTKDGYAVDISPPTNNSSWGFFYLSLLIMYKNRELMYKNPGSLRCR